jgi:hypothetical protein
MSKHYIVIATILNLILLLFICTHAKAQDWSDTAIVNAIYKAEGGKKAQYLYGIRSVSYKNEAEARKICFNTVRNNRKRWIKAGPKGEYLVFLANRYCPIGASNDPKGLNKNWLRLVKYFLNKDNKIN